MWFIFFNWCVGGPITHDGANIICTAMRFHVVGMSYNGESVWIVKITIVFMPIRHDLEMQIGLEGADPTWCRSIYLVDNSCNLKTNFTIKHFITSGFCIILMLIGKTNIACHGVVSKTNIFLKNGILIRHVDFSTHQAIESLDETWTLFKKNIFCSLHQAASLPWLP